MKIHIIGCSGSGKTYLANNLSERYGIPHFDLDDIRWDNTVSGYGIKRPMDECINLLNTVLHNDSWVIEGVYYSWIQQSFEKADIIYVLDMPGSVYITRIILRFFKRKLGLEKGKKESVRSICRLLKWTKTFQKQNFPEIRTLLDQYGDKVIWLSSREDVDTVLQDIGREFGATVAL